MQAISLKQQRDPFADAAALGLLVCAGLNMNGVFTMAFRVGQMVTPIMLLCSVMLIYSYGRSAFTIYLFSFAALIFIYTSLGTYFYSQSDSKLLYQLWQSYIGSILIVWGVSGFVGSIQKVELINKVYLYTKVVFLTGALSVWASPILYRFYLDPPPSFQERMGGFFANPNEAGVVCVHALALCLAVPFRTKFLQTVAIGIIAGGILLTFSKSAMSSGLVVVAWFVSRRVKGIALLIAPMLFVLIAIVVFQGADLIIDFITHSVDLTPQQQERVLSVGRILAGEIGSKESTGRSDVWAIAIERIMAAFPAGGGLGSFHFMIGGILEDKVWLGTHNTLLMIWGEAGLAGLLALLGFIVTIATGLFRYARNGVEVALFLGVLVEMTGSHNALETRSTDIIIGIILGSLAVRERARGSLSWAGTGSLRRPTGVRPAVQPLRGAPNHSEEFEGTGDPANRQLGC